ncbi:hypothetical protein ACSNKO_13820 [Proteus mirabilis]|uniref:hypothetical protein n=1 Tax=Proteus mirabilis TaxID=584 RepID=UPI003F1A98F2
MFRNIVLTLALCGFSLTAWSATIGIPFYYEENYIGFNSFAPSGHWGIRVKPKVGCTATLENIEKYVKNISSRIAYKGYEGTVKAGRDIVITNEQEISFVDGDLFTTKTRYDIKHGYSQWNKLSFRTKITCTDVDVGRYEPLLTLYFPDYTRIGAVTNGPKNFIACLASVPNSVHFQLSPGEKKREKVIKLVNGTSAVCKLKEQETTLGPDFKAKLTSDGYIEVWSSLATPAGVYKGVLDAKFIIP